MRTTLNIDDGLLEEAKLIARQKKHTLGEVVNEALRLGLLRHREGAKVALSPPLKTFRGDGVQAGVDLHDSRNLAEIMEAT